MPRQGSVRIELISHNLKALEDVCNQLKEIANTSGVRIKGPVPLPTKRLRVTVRKSPCGEGGKTWEKWELRIHKRIIYLVNPDDRLMRRIMSIAVPEDVKINIFLP